MKYGGIILIGLGLFGFLLIGIGNMQDAAEAVECERLGGVLVMGVKKYHVCIRAQEVQKLQEIPSGKRPTIL